MLEIIPDFKSSIKNLQNFFGFVALFAFSDIMPILFGYCE